LSNFCAILYTAGIFTEQDVVVVVVVVVIKTTNAVAPQIVE
jgi:hypothetical protein